LAWQGLIDYVKSCGNRAVREAEYALERYFSDSEAVCERFRKTPRPETDPRDLIGCIDHPGWVN
jgi:hypothetical protein